MATDKYLIAGVRLYVQRLSPPPPTRLLCATSLQLNNRPDIFLSLCSSIFPSSPSHSLPSCLFKKSLTDAPSAGAPFHHMLNPLLAIFFPFITRTITQESWRHYAICCNTITSLSHFSAACEGVRTVFQHRNPTNSNVPPLTRERRVCDFLPLPDNRVTLRLVGHL